MALHNESVFEDEVCKRLAADGWQRSTDDRLYDRERALVPDDVFAWIERAYPDRFEKLFPDNLADGQRRAKREEVLDRIVRTLAAHPANGGGTLQVLRHGFQLVGARIPQMMQAPPVDRTNPRVVDLYGRNILRVMEQVHYSTRNHNSIDLVLFVNGIPVSTIELKTEFTQPLSNAIEQYRDDRDPTGEPLLTLGRGALVHFAASMDLVAMTTELRRGATTFLPFNKGDHGAAGNPSNPGGYATDYFWTQVLAPDSLLDIIARFVSYREWDEADLDGNTVHRRQIRFPRYHQWRVVTRLAAAAREEGVGHSYLVQHSAGSGKTDSIAWTAYRLAKLHTDDGHEVFTSVIVITDRRNLDSQLRRALRAIESTPGLFVAIEGTNSSKSRELADALTHGTQIIGVTIQTFPYVLKYLGHSPEGAFAVVADEAHSSQTGRAAGELKIALSGIGRDADTSGAGDGAGGPVPDDGEDSETTIDTEDLLAHVMSARAGDIGNLSFFAFTATPKARTLELFGRADAAGKPQPFDLYTMKQAIQEGYILDVLRNYTTYHAAFQIAARDPAADDVDVDAAKTRSRIYRWAQLHPYNISQKVAVIVEHYRTVVAPLIGGRAKAMVVTSSRKAATRYKRAMDRYIAEHHYGLGTLVAFSGEVRDDEEAPGQSLTEATMNPGLNGRDLARAFAGAEYQVMIVANKFQTGFDQPLLAAMYVDKPLSGITAVQTLSRLNRTTPGKDTTYVLDFVNDPQQIQAAFQDYYEDARLVTASDPQLVLDLAAKIDTAGIFTDAEVEDFARDFYAAKSQPRVAGLLRRVADRYAARLHQAAQDSDQTETRELEAFRDAVGEYVRMYAYFSQMVDYADTRFEKLADFLRLLAPLLQMGAADDPALPDLILTYYRLRKDADQRIELIDGEAEGLRGTTSVGSGRMSGDQPVRLRDVLDKINELFAGTDFDAASALAVFESVESRLISTPELVEQAQVNGRHDFEASHKLREAVQRALYGELATHDDIVKYVLSENLLERFTRLLLEGGLVDRLKEQAAREP